MGAINPTSGRCFPVLTGQWHIMALPECEWEACGKQQLMVDEVASQARPQAIGVRGIANRATMTRITCVARTMGMLAQQQFCSQDRWLSVETIFATTPRFKSR
jgi:hypothetical protein